MCTHQVKEKHDHKDRAEADSGSAAVAPAPVSVVASAACEYQDQKNQEDQYHKPVRPVTGSARRLRTKDVEHRACVVPNRAISLRRPRECRVFRWLPLLVFALALRAQDPGTSAPLPSPSVAEKWNFFNTETVAYFTLGAGAFNAAVSQITHSAPLFGRHPWPTAYPKRFGASIGDIVSQNFFGDFLLTSVFHEDTRYRPRDSSYRLWPRIRYAVSRSVVTQTDTGKRTVNWANILGTAASAALSNAYYPPVSRTVRASVTNWGTDIAGSGMANLMPEFWPDFQRWMKRRFSRRR